MKDKLSSQRPPFKVFNNTVVFIGGEFFSHLLNFITGILVARSLGSEAFGRFSFVFVYLSFFEIFAQFGLNSILTREMAQKVSEAPRILGNAILFRLALIGTSFPVALLLIRALGYPASVQHGVWVASFQLFLALRSIYETVFRVHLLMIYPALTNVLRALINLGLVLGVAYSRPAVIPFILAYLASGLAALVAIAILARHFVRITFQWDWPLIRNLVTESFPLVFSSYLTLLYLRIDVLMLSLMKSFRDVGFYSIATRLTESLDIVSASLMISLFPLLSAAFKENRQEFERLTSKAFRWLLLVGLPLALGGSLAANDLIVLFFGKEFSPSGPCLGILFWYTFFGFFSTLLANLLIVCGRQAVDAWISLFLVLGNTGMNLWLIPPYSYNGAAIATVFTEVVGMIAMLAYLTRHPAIRLPLPVKELVTALRVNVPFFLFLILLKVILHLSLVPFILFGAVSYALFLLALRAVSGAGLKNYFSHCIQGLEGARK